MEDTRTRKQSKKSLISQVQLKLYTIKFRQDSVYFGQENIVKMMESPTRRSEGLCKVIVRIFYESLVSLCYSQKFI